MFKILVELVRAPGKGLRVDQAESIGAEIARTYSSHHYVVKTWPCKREES